MAASLKGGRCPLQCPTVPCHGDRAGALRPPGRRGRWRTRGPESTVFRWVRQDKIDRGELAGTPTVESAELRAAKRRIAELEAELATVKRATELFEKGAQKTSSPIVETLASEGQELCHLSAMPVVPPGKPAP